MRSIIALLTALSFMPLSAAAPKPFFALAWGLDELKKDKPLIVSPYRNITMFYYLEESNRTNIALAKQKLDEQPEGRRTVFDWNVNRRMYNHPDDKLTAANGDKFTAYWWESGIRDAEKAYDEFFGAYKAAGGKLDFFISDLEHVPGADIKKPEHWDAAANDARLSGILGAVNASDLAALRKERSLEWFRMIRYGNYMMAERLNRLFAVAKKHFPNVQCSDYSGYYDNFNLPYAWAPAPALGDFTGSNGLHVGTHQSRSLYGVITWLSTKEFQGQLFGLSAFRAFTFAMNEMRSMTLSSDVPTMPWIAWRGYTHDFRRLQKPPPVACIGATDLYQESVYHAALCNPGNFLLWSAFRWMTNQDPADWTSQSDLKLINDMLDEVNALVGYADRRTLVRELAGWYDPFILTGMTANGKSVWRFTPDIELDQDAATAITSREPLTFSVKGTTVAIPGGKVFEPKEKLSKAGVWVIAPADADPVISK